MSTTVLLVLFGIAAIASTVALIVAPIITRLSDSARERRAVMNWARQQRAGR